MHAETHENTVKHALNMRFCQTKRWFLPNCVRGYKCN